jgi:hypothetical protein
MSIGSMATVAISAEDEQTAAYLAGVGPIMAEGSGARQRLVDGLAQLRAGAGVDQATLAEKQGDAFRVLRAQLGRLTLPRTCSRCHSAVARWLELHEAACMTLAAGGPKALGKAGELVADARGVATQFSAEYSRLVTDTAARQQAAAALAAQTVIVDDMLDLPAAGAEDADEPDTEIAGTEDADEIDAAIADAADLDDPDEEAVEKLAEHLAEVAERGEPSTPTNIARVAYRRELATPTLRATASARPTVAATTPVQAAAKPDLHATARRNGDAAWNALAAVSQARGLHPHGQLGAWLAAVEAVLAASAALTAIIVTAENAVLD